MADDSLELDALFTLNYGLYILSSCMGERFNGQVSNTVMQVTDTPPKLAAAVSKVALTHEFISESGVFAVTVLAESAPVELIGLFGFKSGRDVDKFSQLAHETGSTGCPIVLDHALACIEARVEQTLDCGTHTLFIGDVVHARLLGQGRPMTYSYYREVLGGKTPPTAPTYQPRPVAAAGGKETSGMASYVCEVCGYVYDPEKGDPDNDIAPGTAFEELPDDWVCPVCGAGKDQFAEQ